MKSQISNLKLRLLTLTSFAVLRGAASTLLDIIEEPPHADFIRERLPATALIPMKLGLLQNSHAFLVEAVDCALGARSDPRKWQFAILHLCQSLELGIKALLVKIHPVLVFEDIDKRKHTVGLSKALERLMAPEIGAVKIVEAEFQKIQTFVQLRNKITHADFEFTEQHAEAKFFEIFAFVALFQAQRFGEEIEKIVDANKFEDLLAVKAAMAEVRAKALARIEDEGIEDDYIWECPNCLSPTFVIFGCCRHLLHMQDSIGRCGVPTLPNDALQRGSRIC